VTGRRPPGWVIDGRTGRRALDRDTAAAVRAARVAAQMSQVDLSVRAGCSTSILSGLENGRSVPVLDTAWRIVRCLPLPTEVRRVLIDAATQTPEQRSVYEHAGWTVDAIRHPDGRVDIGAVTPTSGVTS
jgi:transcriptional regulator with XRE-family HTH domain